MTTRERGLYKEQMKKALFSSDNICEMLMGDTSSMSTRQKAMIFNNYAKSHLFIDGTLDAVGSYIFFDITTKSISPTIKNDEIIMYVVCHRDILDDYQKEGYYGNRADILSQHVEDCLVCDGEVANSFGIGKITIDSIDIYNSQNYYGYIMTFGVPNFK